MQLEGRNAVITGAASGIGRALAQRCLEAGMTVVAADVEEPALAATVGELSELGDVFPAICDVSEDESVQRLAAEARERLGDVHLLVNNAGVAGGTGPMWELTLEDWKWTIGVNLWGVILGIKHFVPAMIESREEAHVVNVASLAGLIGPPFMGPYTATKHAVVAISEALHHELTLLQAGVSVSVVCPAFVRTRIHESERNRPEHLRNPEGAGRTPFGEAVLGKSLVEAGSDPLEIADAILEAVRQRRFWVLPHREPLAIVERRARSMIDDQPPPSPFGGFAGE